MYEEELKQCGFGVTFSEELGKHAALDAPAMQPNRAKHEELWRPHWPSAQAIARGMMDGGADGGGASAGGGARAGASTAVVTGSAPLDASKVVGAIGNMFLGQGRAASQILEGVKVVKQNVAKRKNALPAPPVVVKKQKKVVEEEEEEVVELDSKELHSELLAFLTHLFEFFGNLRSDQDISAIVTTYSKWFAAKLDEVGRRYGTKSNGHEKKGAHR